MTHSVGGDDVELLLLAFGDHLRLGDLDGLLLLLLLGLGLLLLLLPRLPVLSRLLAIPCCCRRFCCCFSLGIGRTRRGIGTGGVYIACKRDGGEKKGFLI